ncbi:MAG: N-acetylmuramoyl-L-alanine amidase-like domain-containing protein, partial [Blastocatellia bacterium]
MTDDISFNSRDAQVARQLIAEARGLASVAGRARLISSRFIGLPYIVHPLAGSPDAPERLVIRFDGFDCITYIETVLALSLARSVQEFPAKLREIRYEDGLVEWSKRLHYTSDWAAHQVRRGLLRDMTQGEGAVVREKTLSFIQGLKPKTIKLRYYPKEQFAYVS